ncbi:MAG: GFA family protein [Candidatus Devosia euplotis]|nr:GFA family protein [Candidatus Devosia euplotis]
MSQTEPSTLTMSGGCQCGAVHYHAFLAADTAHLCHCRMCQKAVDNYFEALVGADNARLVWTRGTPAGFMSSEFVERGFCPQCGASLYYRDVNACHTSLTIGSLDHPDQAPPRSHDGIEGRMPWFKELMAIPDRGRAEDGDSAEWAAAIKASNHQHPDHDTDHWSA